MNNYIFNSNIFATYFRYSRILFIIPFIIALSLLIISFYIKEDVIINISLLFFVFCPISLIISLINLLIRNNTKTVIINNDLLEIIKRNGNKIIFTVDNILTYYIVSKSWWAGYLVKNDKDMAAIWKHEFSKSNWKTITKFIDSNCKPKEKLSDPVGLRLSKY